MTPFKPSLSFCRRPGWIGLLLLCLLPGVQAFSQDKAAQVDTVATETDTTVTVEPKEGTSVEKDETKQDLYVARELPDTMVQRWKDDPAMAYANDPDYWKKKVKKERKSDPFSSNLARLLFSQAFQYFIFIVLGALLAFVIVRILVDNNVFVRGSRKKKGTIGADDQPEELEENLNEKLQHYINAQDFRQATRYLYLITLTLLNEKGLIRWHPDATNQDYQRQLSGSSWDRSFRDLTGFYEKVWYGEFPLGPTQFDRLHRYFEDFFKTVPA